MSDPAAIAVETLRAELRQRRHGAIMPRLWHRMCQEWQRTLDRVAIAPATAALAPVRPHRGVAHPAR